MSSKAYQDFVSQPMGCKTMKAVPGIGPVLKRELATKEIYTPQQLLGCHLMDPNQGIENQIKACGGNSRLQGLVKGAMTGFAQQHIN